MNASVSSEARTAYDVLVVGGGMVGAALCLALARLETRGRALSIALLEASEPTPSLPEHEPENFDLRVSAISRASQGLFKALGVWERMAALRVSPFREMHVWDAGGRGEIHFDSAEIGADTLGYIVENRVILGALWEALRGCANVEILCPAEVDLLAKVTGGVELRTAAGRVLHAGLVVGADGAHSVVRGLAGIASQGWSYDQVALVTTVKPERDHRETAWQRFLPTGPLAFLPLTEGYCSIVWSTTPDEAALLLGLEEAEFLRVLEDAFAGRLGFLESGGPRASFPLRLQHALQYVRPGIALVGDAAHTIHPLAGQGVNLGFSDAAVLAEMLADGLDRGKPLGGFGVLRRYERARKGDNLLMMAAMDGLKRLFGTQHAPVRWARNLGLRLTDASGPLKQRIMRHAMGLEGDLPGGLRGDVPD